MFILDARSPVVRQRIAEQVRRFPREAEEEALAWIEAVNILDNEDADAAR
ncbi:hypothetical protein [Skermanella pratensis]|nr:hypothetical protein [Skermanella pratensis]